MLKLFRDFVFHQVRRIMKLVDSLNYRSMECLCVIKLDHALKTCFRVKTTAEGAPVLDAGHVLSALNKLDTGAIVLLFLINRWLAQLCVSNLFMFMSLCCPHADVCR